MSISMEKLLLQHLIKSLKSSIAALRLEKGDSMHLQELERHVSKVALLYALKSNQYKAEMGWFEALPFFETLAASYVDGFDGAGVNFLVFIDPNIPKQLYFDTEVVAFVLRHLLDNALQFTPAKESVLLEVRSKQGVNAHKEIHISVTDTGNGIDKRRIKEVIALETLEKDAAMGLAGCYYALKHFNSDLKIATEPNKGSRFSFVLPLETQGGMSFPMAPELYIGIYTQDKSLFGHTKLLHHYLLAFGVAIVSVPTLDAHASLSRCHAVFMLCTDPKTVPFEVLKQSYPSISMIPLVKSSDNIRLHKRVYTTYMTLPLLPSTLFEQLQLLAQGLSKEALVSHEQEQEAMKTLSQTKRTDPYHILVVEDNMINLKLVQVVLKRFRFIVDVAQNGQEAVDLCQVQQYDLILMDIDMPIMDGVTATKLIKSYQIQNGLPLTPIVALTSHDLVGDREDIIAQGLDEHMPKPLNISRLELMLEHYLGYDFTQEVAVL